MLWEGEAVDSRDWDSGKKPRWRRKASRLFLLLLFKLTTKVRPRARVGLTLPLHSIRELAECAAACTQLLCKETSGDRTHLDQTSLLGTVLV